MKRHQLRLRLTTRVMLGAALILSLPSASSAKSGVLRAAELRGRNIAVQRCSTCHAIDRQGASPRSSAPAFRSLAGRFVGLSLQQKLAEISETGHYDMPSQVLHQDQIADLSAYINGLGRPFPATRKHKPR